MKQTFKTITAVTGLFLSLSVNAQTTLYVPNGTSGIGTSTNAGNVGIGTSTPLAPLNVAGTNANPTSSIPANGALFVGSTATGLALTMGVFSNGGTNPTSWIQSRNQSVASTYYGLSLNPLGGNVNIGTFTVTPTNKLAVAGDIGWGGTVSSSVLSTDQGGSIELGGTNSAMSPVANGTPYLDFHYNTGVAQDFNMRIINNANNRLDFAKFGNVPVMTLNNMNVGIGTTNPVDRLDVTGNIRINDNTVYFRGGIDINHGVGYRGTIPFAGQIIDGPVMFGWNGGGLGATNGGQKLALRWDQNGKVIIGNVTTPGNYSLYVQNGILTERVKVAVATTANWSDYVFANEYKLKTIEELDAFVKENKHLPNVPSAQDVVKDGIDMATMDAKLLEKIEELSLYIIQLKKENVEFKKENVELVKRVEKVENK